MGVASGGRFLFGIGCGMVNPEESRRFSAATSIIAGARLRFKTPISIALCTTWCAGNTDGGDGWPVEITLDHD
jgi:hypothetical protein